MTIVAALIAIAFLTKTMVVLLVIGRSLDEADREEGDNARRLNRRAAWLGLEEVIWFFAACSVLSVLSV